jgi:sporulation protein YlmC with PRC-barrel domain
MCPSFKELKDRMSVLWLSRYPPAAHIGVRVLAARSGPMISRFAPRAAAALALCAAVATPATAQRGVFAADAPNVQTPGQISSDKLIGRSVRNAQDKVVGEIKSVALGPDGRVQAVIVGVGGFLGVGEREVAIGWDNLRIRDNGEVIATDLSEQQLRGLPEYKYADTRQRGSVFGPGANTQATQSADRAPTTYPPSAWNMRASELIGMDVRNAQNESIGQVRELLVDMRGEIQALVVSVGGFLGLGDRHVAVGWKQFQFNREKGGLAGRVTMSREQLKALPEYKLPKR